MATIIGNWDFTQLLLPSEVAEKFVVDPKTVTRWAATGRIAASRTPGGHRRYSAEQVAYLLAGGSPKCDGLDRSDLTGHTIGVEPLTRAMCVRSGLPVETAGELAAVERSNGEFVKVWETQSELTDSTIEAAARSIARSHRVTFVGGAR